MENAQYQIPSAPAEPVITIDGPAGAGKTTVSRRLAQQLDYRYVDTGALYRGVAVAAAEAGLAPDAAGDLAKLCRSLKLTFQKTSQGLRLICNGRDISEKIRAPRISMLASAVSALPEVRACLLAVQRQMGREGGVVFEGRDMGTVVFPQAQIKFYLDADPSVRAQRRYEELQENTPQTLEKVTQDMQRRDMNDTSRAVAPLKPAADAIHIDSSNQSIEQVIQQMLTHIERYRRQAQTS